MWLANFYCWLRMLFTPEWVTAIGTVGAVIVALLLALYGDWLRRWRFRPQLLLEARVQRPDAEKTIWRSQVGGIGGVTVDIGDVYFFRLAIENRGNAEALDSQVFLASVDRVIGSRVEPVDRFTPMNLKWAYIGRPTLPVLLPNMPRRFCDFVHVTNPACKRVIVPNEDLPRIGKDEAVLALDLETIPNTLGNLLEAGTYRFGIVLAASNFPPRREVLEVVFPGKWFDDQDMMFSAGFTMRKL